MDASKNELAQIQPSKSVEPSDDQSGEERIQGYFSGPLPPPIILEGYERVAPGIAEKIIKMALDEQSHRHAIEQAEHHNEASQIRRGQIFGLSVAFGILTASVVIVLTGKSWATSIMGSILGVGGLASIAAAFVHAHDGAARKPAKEEHEDGTVS